MNAALVRQIVFASASGLLYPLCFPDYDLGQIAWVFLLPLHFALEGSSLRRAFWLGWLTGVILSIFIAGSWIVTAINFYGKMPILPSYLFVVLLTSYLGLYFAGYALALRWLRQRVPALAFLGAPCIWVALELLRTYLFTGLPWCLLGYSQYRWLPAIQIADHTGVYGLSFLVVLVNGALTELGLWASRWARRVSAGTIPWPSPAAAVFGMSITLVYGYVQLGNTPKDESITVGVVQPNIDQARKWDATYQDEILERYRRLTVEAADNSDLVIWPESAMPFMFERVPKLQAILATLVQSQEIPLLYGNPTLRFFPNGRRYLLNSAYLLSPTGLILNRYDKQHLVPFGEYIPLHSSLLFFMDKLVEGFGDYEPGVKPTIFEIHPKSGGQAIKFGVVICWEVIFPDLVREIVSQGAVLMTAISNDAWFGRSAAPFQHFSTHVFRAVENRVAFARAANTGISGLIDPQGRILHATPIFQELAVSGTLPVGRVVTFYTRYGDVFAYACVVISGILLASAYYQGRQGAMGHRQKAKRQR